MRKVLAFLVWLFSFWTWKDFFLRWLRRPPFYPAREETAGSEHLSSQEGHPESELARFLSSLPEDQRCCRRLDIDGDSAIELEFGRTSWKTYHAGVQAGYREFLGAVASSEIKFIESVGVCLQGDDSFKHMEAFGDALRRSDNAFRKLELDCWCVSAIPFAECLSNVLLGNIAIQGFHLSIHNLNEKMGKEDTAEFVAIVDAPYILQILKSFTFYGSEWDSEGTELLMKSLNSPDSVLEELGMVSQSSDAHLQHISGLLATSTSLKRILVNPYDGERYKCVRGYSSIASALCSNRSLQVLECGISSCMELKVLLDPLMPQTNNFQPNTTLTHLELQGTVGGKEGIEILVGMLRTNMSLLSLKFFELDELCSEDAQVIENVLAILEALKTNKSLKKIDFSQCTGVGGYKVLGTMMDLLLENHCIEEIDLAFTGLDASGDAQYVYSALSKRKNMKLWSIVQGMANVKPTSGRVFLCGQPFAGKTRLRLSMLKQLSEQLKEFQPKDEIQNTSWLGNKMRRVFRKLQVPIKVPMMPKQDMVLMMPKQDMVLERTQGIEVDNVLCDDICISVWDMAGQTDYHSFHELVMPNFSADGSCSIFLLMCDPMEHLDPFKGRCLESVKEELESWLRFIASNTRRSNSYRPHVSIVMTHFDHWKHDGPFVARIEDEVTKLRVQFQEVLEFDDDKIVFKVDGTNVSDAGNVFDFIKSHLKQLLERLPQTISACEEVQHLLAQWNEDKSRPSLLKWDEFCESMCKDIEDFNIADHELAKRRKEFVAISLSDAGHIIYDEKDGVVITNPHWFCHDIMGQFLHQCTNKGFELGMILSNGVISIDHVKRFMLNLIQDEGDVEKKFDDILGMMKKLQLCYEQDANHILIPSTLKKLNEKLSWCEMDESRSFKYVGRRVACQDGLKTMLTAGFFTRLQVSFFETLQSNSDQHTYKVFQDVIKFITTGIEVILQFNHGDIDILIRSDQSQDKMLAFLEIHIIDHIKHLQEDPTLGCPGVRLTEYILRPECVEKLLSPMDRKSQVVHVKELEVEVMIHGADARHSWGSCEGLDVGYHAVKTLLGDVAYHNLLVNWTCQLEEYHKKIQSLDSSTQNDPSFYDNKKVDVSTTIRWKIPWPRFNRDVIVELKNIKQMQMQNHKEVMSKLDAMSEMIQRLEHTIKDTQKKLLHEVCSRIDDLMAFSIELKSSQVPKVAYLSEIGNRKLLTRFVPGLNRIKLHLMCESIHGFHQVANQEGYVVNFATEETRRYLTMIAYGLKIATILTKIGAHVACGMGEMVPNFSDGCNFAALILDSSDFLEYPIPMITLESLPSEVENVSKLSIDDTSDAQSWLRDFLERKYQNKRDFYETFKLKKVKYRSSKRGSIAWICDGCLSNQDDPKDVLN